MLRQPIEFTQYASSEHQALLAKHGLVGSMSRKGNCWDNAVMERFFLNLKMERVWQKDYANHAEAANDIADYIVGFYNCESLHSKLGNLSPNCSGQVISDSLIDLFDVDSRSKALGDRLPSFEWSLMLL